MRLHALLPVLMACHSAPSGSSDAGTPVDKSSVEASSRPSSNPSAVEAPAVKGSTVKVELASGATLTLPSVAVSRPVASQERLPDVVSRAHLFNLGGPKRLLMLSEMNLAGRGCDEALDQELGRMNEAKDDTARTKYRKMGNVETLTISGKRVLYADSMNRGLGSADAGRQAVAMATLIMCRKPDYLVLMYTLDQSDLPAGTKAMMTGVAASYAAKP